MLQRYNYVLLLCQEDDMQDVEFVVCREISGTGEEVEGGRIKAHKLLLSLVSPVFKSQFFGPLAKSSGSGGIINGIERVVIKGHNFDAFKVMVEFIYSDDLQKITASTDLLMLFDLFALSDKYFLDFLKTVVQGTIDVVELSLQDYKMVIPLLLQYSELTNFEDICSDLKARFSKIAFKEQIENPTEFLNLWENASDQEKGLLDQLLLMLPDKKNYCKNCRKLKQLCLDGKKLAPKNCRVGMRVKLLIEEEFESELDDSIIYTVPAQTQGTITELYHTGHIDIDFNLGVTVKAKFPDECIRVSCTSSR